MSRAWFSKQWSKLQRLEVALALMGCLTLVGCVILAATSGPASEPVSVTECQDLGGSVAEAPSDNRGVLRIGAIWPPDVEIGDNLCLVIAGVSSNTILDAKDLEAERAARARDLEKSNLDAVLARSASRSEEDAARKLYLQAVSDYQAALEAVAKPPAPTKLIVYLNNVKAPLTVMARTTHEPQWLYIPMVSPDNATAEGADFWRKLVSNVAYADIEDWGRQPVVVGLSRAATASDVPEATSYKEAPSIGGTRPEETAEEKALRVAAEVKMSEVEKAAEAQEKRKEENVAEAKRATGFKIYVYSFAPFIAGLLSLAFFSSAFYFLAVRTSLLRDNDLRLRDVFPGPFRTAQDTLPATAAIALKARKALEGNRTDASLIKTLDDAVAAETAAQAKLDEMKAVLGDIDPNLVPKLIALQAWDRALNGSEETRRALESVKSEAQTDQQTGLVKAIDNWMNPPTGLREALLTEARLEATESRTTQQDTDLMAARTEINGGSALAAAEQDQTNAPAPVSGQQKDPKRVRADTVVEAVRAKLEELRKAARSLVATGASSNSNEEEWVQSVLALSGNRPVGTFSLGRSQMAFWLFVVVAGYIYIAMSIGQVFGIMDENVLALLGISSATGLGSVLINQASATGDMTRGYLSDVLGANGSPQLQRIQALAWTLILGAIFIWIVIGQYRFPVIDTTLLLLMGLVSGFYLGFKFQER